MKLETLEKVLKHCNNWFALPGGIHADIYSIEGGALALPFLLNGQYFRVRGSVLNDGLHQKNVDVLADEVFNGEIWALAVPKAVQKLAEDIETWEADNAKTLASPYKSESFGGYSYTKAEGKNGAVLTWKDAFRGELKQWRKI